MPVYEFSCKKCKKIYEEYVKKSTDGPEDGCPDCHSMEYDKLVSSFAISNSDITSSKRWNSMSYRFGHNLEKAKRERAAAEAASHIGEHLYSDPTPDLNNDKTWGKL